MKTISDLKLDWAVSNYTFKNFKNHLIECNSKINFDNYKIRDNNYIFAVDVLKANVDFSEFNDLSDWYEIETIKVKSKNLSLIRFLYKLNKKLDKLLEKRDDWHFFIEEIKLISSKCVSSNLFLIHLGS